MILSRTSGAGSGDPADPRTEFAPAAIEALFQAASAALSFPVQLGGILGDQAHTYGYHRARAVLPAEDYSVQLPRDRVGCAWAASALDITPTDPTGVAIMTRRLMRAAARMDKRLHPLREFFGTLDGRHVYGYDLHRRVPVQADDSHLWHLHLSIHRDVACRRARLLPLAEVLAGR